ncbi:MAG: ATP-binding protein [Actinobacteria bacterium]|nr:ATP-binding protein [Actinomycetota bacterium]MBM3712493.1 ATP-binding protein [Actinomycetota bacterium]
MSEFSKYNQQNEVLDKEIDESSSDTPINGRIAIYDNIRSIPRIIELSHDSVKNFLDQTPQIIYSLSHQQGGLIPYTIIKEVVENLIHANFKEITITIMDGGNHIIVSDQGPGITDKVKAFMPGYSSATQSMKKYIRGVGSGLPIVKETITFSGGSVNIDDNIKNGTVISLKIEKPQIKTTDLKKEFLERNISETSTPDKGSKDYTDKTATVSIEDLDKKAKKSLQEDIENIKLSSRQIKVLSLILELEETGPSKIANELGFSLSTSYRELIFLESLGLLSLTESGKRKLTLTGEKYLEYYSNNF